MILVADTDIELTMRGLLSSPVTLGIRPIDFEVFTHPRHDPGCVHEGVSFLTKYSGEFSHGLLVLDHEGSGREDRTSNNLEDELDCEFRRTAWDERCKAIVLEPELEAWVWSTSPHVYAVAGWKGRGDELRSCLVGKGLWRDGEMKPHRPKEAFHVALRAARKPRSVSLYWQIAERVSLERCADRSFHVFRDTVRKWFSCTGEEHS